MPKKLRSLDDHVEDISTSRDRSGAGRFQPVAAGTELVGDVVLTSCSTVAEAFADQGFRWAKSGLRFSRKVGPFTHIVSFQSDSANTSGHYVAVAMHAQVKSAALEKWRQAHNGVTDDASLWITQVGYLSPAHEYLKWQLVDPLARAGEIQSMIDTVRNLVLPAFDACSSMENLSARLLERSEIVRYADWALDIALWVGNKQAAESLVKIFLESRPDLAGFFYQEYERQRRAPIVGTSANRYQALVRLCIDHALQIPGLA